jgi:DNA mismatch repair protein MutL
VRAALRAADLTPRFDLGRTAFGAPSPGPRGQEFGSGLMPAPAGAAMGNAGETAPSPPWVGSFVEYFRRLDPRQKGFVFTEVKQAVAAVAPELIERESRRPIEVNAPNGAGEADPAQEPTAAMPTVRSAAEAMQVHSSYIVTQDEEGLVIIDQHALHERVIFEKLKERLERGTLESQRLLMPATADARPSQIEALESLQPVLRRLGIEAEAIGPAAIAVHSFTTLLFERSVEPGSFVRDLLEKAASGGSAGADQARDPEAVMHEVLDMMACKAAVKAGDRLAPHELAELLKYRHTIERSSNCPHGRPTSLRLTIRDLDRQFGRA